MAIRDDDAMNDDLTGGDNVVPVFTEGGHVDEGTIHAWLDGAFDDVQSAPVKQHVASCDECGAAVAEARGFIAGASRVVRALDAVPANVVPEADVARTASRIIAAADATRVATAKDVTTPSASKGGATTRRPWYMARVWSAAAAVLVMVVGGSYVLRQNGNAAVNALSNAGEAVADTAIASGAAAAVTTPSVPATLSRPTDVSSGAPSQARAAAPVTSDADVLAERDASADKQRVEERQLAVGATRSQSASADAMKDGSPTKKKRESAPVVSSAGVENETRMMAAGSRTRTVSTPAPAAAPVAAERSAPVAASGVVAITEAIKPVAPPPVALAAAAPASAPTSTPASAPQFVPLSASPTAKTAGAPTTSRTASNRMFDARRRDEAPPSQCWSLQGEAARDGLRLPLELQVPDIDGVKSYGVRWIGWPDSTTAQMVSMRVDNDGRLSGEGLADGQRVRLVLQRIVNGWQGTATHTIDGERTVQKVQLKRVSDTMCNP